jgi:hypothetical protein
MTDKSLLDTLRAHSYEVEPSAAPVPEAPRGDSEALVFDDFLPASRKLYGPLLLFASVGIPILALGLLWSLLPSVPLAPASAAASGSYERARTAHAAADEATATMIRREEQAAAARYVAAETGADRLNSKILSDPSPGARSSDEPPAVRAVPAVPVEPERPVVAAAAAPPPAAAKPEPRVAVAPPLAAAKPEPHVAAASEPPTAALRQSHAQPAVATKHASTASAAASAQAKALRVKGDELMGMGDVATARLYYERAADAGDGRAALLAGHTYNPEILAGFGVKGMQGDMAEAEKWYERARALGEKDAARELADLPAAASTR